MEAKKPRSVNEYIIDAEIKYGAKFDSVSRQIMSEYLELHRNTRDNRINLKDTIDHVIADARVGNEYAVYVKLFLDGVRYGK